MRHPPFDYGHGRGQMQNNGDDGPLTTRLLAVLARAIRWSAAAGCGLLLADAAFAEPVTVRRVPLPVVSCGFEGWSNDPDPGGLPVRATPEPSGMVLGRLPPPRSIGLDEVAVNVKVTGYRDGWFRIDTALFRAEADPNSGLQSNVAFKGAGWVPSAMIKAALASPTLFTAPRKNAPRKASLQGRRPDGRGGFFQITPDQVAVKRLLSCNGPWVEADTEFGIGWVDRVCGRQLEGC
jgi:hypothetical protein